MKAHKHQIEILPACDRMRLHSFFRKHSNKPNPLKAGVFLLFIMTLIASQISLAATNQLLKYEDNDVMVRLFFRTPDQLEAFYIGRGFQKEAISKIQQTCFITAIIKNKNVNVLWLDLDNWLFSTNSKPITRIKRDYWKRRDESVGGNMAIPMQAGSFDLVMQFKTGPDKNGEEKKVVFRNLVCGTNKP
jgi:hypothetical protein